MLACKWAMSQPARKTCQGGLLVIYASKYDFVADNKQWKTRSLFAHDQVKIVIVTCSCVEDCAVITKESLLWKLLNGVNTPTNTTDQGWIVQKLLTVFLKEFREKIFSHHTRTSKTCQENRARVEPAKPISLDMLTSANNLGGKHVVPRECVFANSRSVFRVVRPLTQKNKKYTHARGTKTVITQYKQWKLECNF